MKNLVFPRKKRTRHVENRICFKNIIDTTWDFSRVRVLEYCMRNFPADIITSAFVELLVEFRHIL